MQAFKPISVQQQNKEFSARGDERGPRVCMQVYRWTLSMSPVLGSLFVAVTLIIPISSFSKERTGRGELSLLLSPSSSPLKCFHSPLALSSFHGASPPLLLSPLFSSPLALCFSSPALHFVSLRPILSLSLSLPPSLRMT